MYFPLPNSLEYLRRTKDCFEDFVPSFRYIKQAPILRVPKGDVKNDVRKLGHR